MIVKFRFWPIFALFLGACTSEEGQIARPYAFHKLEFPQQAYVVLENECPFAFEFANHARIIKPMNGANSCWLNVEYPQLNAKIHLTYASFDDKDELGRLINDAYRMTYKHTVKASSIEEIPIHRSEKRVFGFYFKVGGNAASSSQFYVTDSTGHFLRGALYFESESRADSLEPLIAYMRNDLEHMLESFRWK